MKSLLSIALFFTVTAFATPDTLLIAEMKFGNLQCRYEKAFEPARQDTSIYVVFTFKVERTKNSYQSFTLSMDKDELSPFINDLNNAFNAMGKKNASSWNSFQYTIALSSSTKEVLLYSKDEGHCTLSKKQAEALLDWLEELI